MKDKNNSSENQVNEEVILDNLRQLSFADLQAVRDHLSSGFLTVARANPGLYRDQQYLFSIEKFVRGVFAEKLKQLTIPGGEIK